MCLCLHSASWWPRLCAESRLFMRWGVQQSRQDDEDYEEWKTRQCVGVKYIYVTLLDVPHILTMFISHKHDSNRYTCECLQYTNIPTMNHSSYVVTLPFAYTAFAICISVKAPFAPFINIYLYLFIYIDGRVLHRFRYSDGKYSI